MSENNKKFKSFIGLWSLIPESCKYQQGDAPIKGSYKIEYKDENIVFTMNWTDKENKDFSIEFSGIPDGKKVPFNGGALADEMAITAVSERELNSYAYLNGKELMIAQRQLDDTGMAMRITQVVDFQMVQIYQTKVYTEDRFN